MGDRVHGLQLPGGVGQNAVAVHPPWALVLSYELNMRREAMRHVIEKGEALHVALSKFVKDPGLKDGWFTTPLALTPSESPQKYQRTGAEGKGRGRGRGRGGGGGQGKREALKGKAKPMSIAHHKLAFRTPEGREICIANNPGETCPGQCGRVHVCWVQGCLGTLPAYTHDRHAAKEAAKFGGDGKDERKEE